MSGVALTFAVLGGGGSAADLGYVFAAGVVPQVAFMLGGGVVADRLGRRPVMLAADLLRFAVQATLAAALLAGAPRIWQFVVLNGLLGSGEAFFAPSLAALTPDIAPRGRLSDANALLELAQSAAQVTGPAAAGILVAITTPGVVIALDAASYGVSVIALGLLRLPARRAARRCAIWPTAGPSSGPVPGSGSPRCNSPCSTSLPGRPTCCSARCWHGTTSAARGRGA